MSDTLTIQDATSLTGDSLEVWVREGVVYLSVENPWAGSTDTGFGYTTTTRLTAEQARELIAFLSARLADR